MEFPQSQGGRDVQTQIWEVCYFPFLLLIFVLPVALPLCVKHPEFRVRGRNVTIAEAWLLCRKHRPTRQTCQWTALGKRSQGTVCGGEQKEWCTVELVSKRIPHLQSVWISRQEQQLVMNRAEHYWQTRMGSDGPPIKLRGMSVFKPLKPNEGPSDPAPPLLNL